MAVAYGGGGGGLQSLLGSEGELLPQQRMMARSTGSVIRRLGQLCNTMRLNGSGGGGGGGECSTRVGMHSSTCQMPASDFLCISLLGQWIQM